MDTPPAVLITRPQPDAGATARRLRRLGYATRCAPMCTIKVDASAQVVCAEALAGLSPDGGVLCTSRRALRVLWTEQAPSPEIRRLPLYIVGEESAAYARRRLRWEGAIITGATGRDLLARMQAADAPLPTRFVYPSACHISIDFQAPLMRAGTEVERIALYTSVPVDGFSPRISNILRRGGVDGVLLYSARTARIWRRHVEQAGLEAQVSGMPHFCLSGQVADILASGWRRHVAGVPAQHALETLLQRVLPADVISP